MLPDPDRLPFRWIRTTDALTRACALWRRRVAVGLDTEFVRERTYYAQLGLLQVAVGLPGDDLDIVLVDPLEIDDLSPLAELLDDPAVVKILHSPSEDLEILHRAVGSVPTPLFDTQIAAALTGHGWSLGFAPLVDGVFGAELPKGQTRSNWLRRPLSDDQVRYAALDVAYLPLLHRHLARELDDLGRGAWMREEMAPREDSSAYGDDDLITYRKLRRRRASARQLGVLRALCIWREREARRRDLPRNFIVPEQALGEIAAKTPRSLAQLRRIRSLRPRDLERHGRSLLSIVAEALDTPAHELPAPMRQPRDLAPYKAEVKALRAEIESIAARHGLPPELLANRRAVEAAVRHHLDGHTQPLPAFDGWRRPVVGEPLVEAMRRLVPRR
ncbi:MAG: ribonuclease D [Acidobacteriota bacterium]